MTNIKKEFVDMQSSEFRQSDDNPLYFLNRHNKILNLILNNSGTNSNVLDIGCSDGKILKKLEEIGYKNLYALDFQEISKNTFSNSKVKFKVCDIENETIPFKKKFDVIIFSDVLEHLFSPQTVLFDVIPFLKKGGKVIISVPNAGWFLNGVLLTFFPSKLFISTAFGPWGHTFQFTFYMIRRIAYNLKLKVKVIEGAELDNYAFREGIKKILFDIFAVISSPLTKIFPSIFSAHIFSVLEYNGVKLRPTDRIDTGS